MKLTSVLNKFRKSGLSLERVEESSNFYVCKNDLLKNEYVEILVNADGVNVATMAIVQTYNDGDRTKTWFRTINAIIESFQDSIKRAEERAAVAKLNESAVLDSDYYTVHYNESRERYELFIKEDGKNEYFLCRESLDEITKTFDEYNKISSVKAEKHAIVDEFYANDFYTEYIGDGEYIAHNDFIDVKIFEYADEETYCVKIRVNPRGEYELFKDFSTVAEAIGYSKTIENEKTLNDVEMSLFEVKRERMSVTQGSASVYYGGYKVVTFVDKIELIPDGSEYYGEIIGGWASIISDYDFIQSVLNHPLDEIYHFSDKMREVMKEVRKNGATRAIENESEKLPGYAVKRRFDDMDIYYKGEYITTFENDRKKPENYYFDLVSKMYAEKIERIDAAKCNIVSISELAAKRDEAKTH